MKNFEDAPRAEVAVENSGRRSWYNYSSRCRDGGAGRRSGLKIRRPSGLGGSTPPPGTNHLLRAKDLETTNGQERGHTLQRRVLFVPPCAPGVSLYPSYRNEIAPDFSKKSPLRMRTKNPLRRSKFCPLFTKDQAGIDSLPPVWAACFRATSIRRHAVKYSFSLSVRNSHKM